MSNETEAPERIYLKPQDAALFNHKYGHPNVPTVMVGDDYVIYTLFDAKDKRIEELEAKLRIYEGCNGQPVSSTGMIAEMAGALKRSEKHVAELKSKLAKAEKTLMDLSEWRQDCHRYDADCGHELRYFDIDDVLMMEDIARATLAELTTKPTERETP